MGRRRREPAEARACSWCGKAFRSRSAVVSKTPDVSGALYHASCVVEAERHGWFAVLGVHERLPARGRRAAPGLFDRGAS